MCELEGWLGAVCALNEWPGLCLFLLLNMILTSGLPCTLHDSVLQVVKQEGQAEVGSDVLAPVLDDAVVTWSSTAHAARLHLVRGHDFALSSPQSPSASHAVAMLPLGRPCD